MEYCKKCLQADTRPKISFNDEGVCYACEYEEIKKSIDWKARQAELLEIVKWAKQNSNGYDCAVGVSGGKDSIFQALYAKEKLGLNVLLVNGEPDDITDIGRANIENLINKGFDCIKLRPNPVIAKKIAKRAFYEYGNLIKPSEYALWASTYIIADKFDIPLIIQGENAALTLGVKSSGLGIDGNAFNVNKCNTLNNCDASDWVDDETSVQQLMMYQFPDVKKMNHKYDGEGIKAIYLQYYAKEWSLPRNGDFAIARGLKCRTDSPYDIGAYRLTCTLDTDLAVANQMIKYYKFGFGFTTDLVCYDIREGLLSREDAKWLVNEYDGRCSEEYLKKYCEYIDISVEEFWRVMEEKFINKQLFYKDDHGKWLPKFKVGIDLE